VGDVTISGKLTWQACNDQLCFAPQRNQVFSVATKIVAASEAVTPADGDLFKGFDQSVFAHGAEPVAAPMPQKTDIEFFGWTFSLGSASTGLFLLIALAVGIIFNLMPCVLPVVPLKAMGFYEVSQHNRARCFLLGIIFSLGVIAFFFVLAMLIIVSRQLKWGQLFSYGWVIWSVVAILVLMAMGQFGLFELTLPRAVTDVSLSHDSLAGNFLFGAFTALLSTPCTAPMFPGILAWSLAQPVGLGVAAMLTVGVGMALPYLILSAFPQLTRWLPRTGAWSAVLKQMMGFLIIAVAVYFAGGRLASSREFVWAVFGVVAGAMLFLIVRTIQISGRAGPIVASLLTAGAVVAVSLSVTFRLTGGLIWQPFSAQALADARATGRPVMVEFTANWCGNCLALEGTVFQNPLTAKEIKNRNVILLRADLTDEKAPGWDMVNELNPGGGIPLTAIYGPGKTDPIKLTSLYTTQNLIDALGRASGG
jgi:thiol:disulfide interchange protein DsbD